MMTQLISEIRSALEWLEENANLIKNYLPGVLLLLELLPQLSDRRTRWLAISRLIFLAENDWQVLSVDHRNLQGDTNPERLAVVLQKASEDAVPQLR